MVTSTKETTIPVGQALRALRKACGWSLREAEKHTGIGYQNLSAYENDRRVPSLQMIRRIANAYGHDVMVTFSTVG